MKGTRIGMRLMILDRIGHPHYSVEFGGRVTEHGANTPLARVKEALYEIETLVNDKLPHLRLHISMEEVR